MSLSVDASNSCIPPTCNLLCQIPPLPKTERGIPLVLHGNSGRRNSGEHILLYPSRQFVIARNILTGKSFVYRGHTANVTVAKFSPSGAYVASADVRGKLRIWSFDHEEHLCKLDIVALSGPIRDLCWDLDSQRIAVVGEGSPSDPSSVCARVLQWDTGVKLGDLGQHARKKASTCAFRPARPMRIITGGSEDFKCSFNKGPPFQKVSFAASDSEKGFPQENVHRRGSVHCVRYNHDGSMVASVGTDKTVAFYNGVTLELLHKLENVHDASIYSCDFNHDGTQLLTCSADGTAKLISTCGFQVIQSWNVASALFHCCGRPGSDEEKVPLGGMLMGCNFVHGGNKGVDVDTSMPLAVALNGKICMLSTQDSSVSSMFSGHQAPISALAIHHNKGIMYTCDSDGTMVQWDISKIDNRNGIITAIDNVQRDLDAEQGPDETAMNKVHAGAISGVVLSNSDDLDPVILSVGWDDYVRVTKDRRTMSKIKLFAQPNAIARGMHLAAILTVEGIQLLKHGNFVSDHMTLSYTPMSVCVSDDDCTLYVGGDDCNVHIYRVIESNDGFTSLEERHQLSGVHGQPIYSLAISNDGTKLASASIREICVWDIVSGYDLIIGKSRWCFHQQRINDLAWSNDDSVLASAGNDDSIYFWSLQKKTTRVHYPHTHRGGVTAIEFLRNVSGMILVSVGNDACINTWDVTDDLLSKFG